MQHAPTIPELDLYGEPGTLPDAVHCEDFVARAPISDWRIEAHRHRHITQLMVLFEGAVDARVDRRRFTMTAGDFLFIPDNSAHDLSIQPGSDGMVLSVLSSALNTAAPYPEALRQTLSHPGHGQMTDTLAQTVQVIRASFAKASAFEPLILITLAQAVLAQVAEVLQPNQSNVSSPGSERLRALDGLIHSHLADGWSASDYARALNISTGHLSRMCRAASGIGAAAYIEQKRIMEACRLLAFTALPMAEIGYRLGYSDPSYFSKRFRSIRGITPSGYRSKLFR